MTLHLIRPSLSQRSRLTATEDAGIARVWAAHRDEQQLAGVRRSVRRRIRVWRWRRALRDALRGALAWVTLGRWRAQ
jgi:hypothetical protein